jgi:hypothetical protein
MKSIHVRKKEIGLPYKPRKEVNILNSEANILSFIVRVWMEEPTSKIHPPIWRGHITLIPHGKRHYFKNIYEIPSILLTHLKVQK